MQNPPNGPNGPEQPQNPQPQGGQPAPGPGNAPMPPGGQPVPGPGNVPTPPPAQTPLPGQSPIPGQMLPAQPASPFGGQQAPQPGQFPSLASQQPLPVHPTSAAPMLPAMNQQQGVSGAKGGKGWIVVTAVVIVVLILGGVLAWSLTSGGSSPSSMATILPSNTEAYLSVTVSPSGTLSQNLDSLYSHFPQFSSATVRNNDFNQTLNSAFGSSDTGVTAAEVRAWLGSQVAIAAVPDGSSTDAVILIASTNNSDAQSTLTKLEHSSSVTGTVKTTSYEGTTISSATYSGAVTYVSLVENTVVVTSGLGSMESVISTSQGKTPELAQQSEYTQTMAKLPGNALSVFYVNPAPLAKQLVSSLGSEASSLGAGSSEITSIEKDVAAIQGIGGAVVPNATSLHFVFAVVYNESKLTPAEKTAIFQTNAANPLVKDIPSDTYGFLVASGLKITESDVNTYLMSLGVSSELDPVLDQLGLLGPGSVLNDLTGTYGLEVNPVSSSSSLPAGGDMYVGTTNDAAMSAFLSKLAAYVNTSAGNTAPIATTTADGTTISSDTFPSSLTGGTPLTLSWAVANGTAIIGLSPSDVEAALTADGGVSSSANYRAAVATVPSVGGSEVYLNIHAILQEVQSVIGSSGGASLSQEINDLSPIQSLISVSDVSGNATISTTSITVS